MPQPGAKLTKEQKVMGMVEYEENQDQLELLRQKTIHNNNFKETRCQAKS